MQPARFMPAAFDSARDRDGVERLGERRFLFGCYALQSPSAHKAFYLRVHVEEADATLRGEAFEALGERFKIVKMVGNRIALAYEDGAVAPYHAMGPDGGGEFLESPNEVGFRWQRPFDIGAVCIQRELHVIGVRGKLVEALEHGFWILRPKRNAVDGFRSKGHTGNA